MIEHKNDPIIMLFRNSNVLSKYWRNNSTDLVLNNRFLQCYIVNKLLTTKHMTIKTDQCKLCVCGLGKGEGHAVLAT